MEKAGRGGASAVRVEPETGRGFARKRAPVPCDWNLAGGVAGAA